MKRHVAIVGAGAVGGFAGGVMADAGQRVSLIDPWPQHVERIRRDGLKLSGTGGERLVEIDAFHSSEVQQLEADPVDVAFVCTKAYDTRWAATLIAPFLSPQGFVVTMQNGMVEDDAANVVGRERVLGCVVSRFQVEAVEPGHVRRTNAAGGADYVVFRVGEVDGRATARAQETIELLQLVDSANVTTNLWGERWSKLVANAMTSAVCGVSGLPFKQMYEDLSACRVIARLAHEAIEVGRALGFDLEAVYGHPPQRYLDAAGGGAAALEALATSLRASQVGSLDGGRSGIAQDLAKGRRTEVEYMNGYVASKAADVAVDVPTQRAITAMVQAIERGELHADTRNLGALLRDHVKK